MADQCGATIDLANDRTITCVLAPDHAGPVHNDAAGETWGDAALSEPVAGLPEGSFLP
jgi:hypothetical protein